MHYDFQVKPEIYKLFVEDATEEDIGSLKTEFNSFRITYNSEPDEGNPYSLLEILNAENDHQQILLWGVKEHNSKSVLAYWFVGDGSMEDEVEDYEHALKMFKTMQQEYKI